MSDPGLHAGGGDARLSLQKVHAALQPGDYKIADYHDGAASVLFRCFEYRSYEAVPASYIDEQRVLT
jgi:hypothetical protein